MVIYLTGLSGSAASLVAAFGLAPSLVKVTWVIACFYLVVPVILLPVQ
jgi:preprotein translocase subunit SecG